MKKIIKTTNLSGIEILLIIHQLFLGFSFSGRGVFWLINKSKVLDDSTFYLALHKVMPIWIWGLIILITGLFIIISAFYVPFINQNNKFYKFSFIGTTSSTIFYFIMLTASIDNNLNWLTPYNFAIQTVWSFLIAVVSGWKLYERRK